MGRIVLGVSRHLIHRTSRVASSERALILGVFPWSLLFGLAIVPERGTLPFESLRRGCGGLGRCEKRMQLSWIGKPVERGDSDGAPCWLFSWTIRGLNSLVPSCR